MYVCICVCVYVCMYVCVLRERENSFGMQIIWHCAVNGKRICEMRRSFTECKREQDHRRSLRGRSGSSSVLRPLLLECPMVLRGNPILMYGGEAKLWKKEKCRKKVAQTGNLRGFLGYKKNRRNIELSEYRNRELGSVKKVMEERGGG